jgi:hypothetical protein
MRNITVNFAPYSMHKANPIFLYINGTETNSIHKLTIMEAESAVRELQEAIDKAYRAEEDAAEQVAA